MIDLEKEQLERRNLMRRAKVRTRLFVQCPECEEEVCSVDHLVGIRVTHFGPCPCPNIECDCVIDGAVYPNGEVLVGTVENDHPKVRDAWVLLRLCELVQDEPVHIVVSDRLHENGNAKFYYDEHACPSGFLRHVITQGTNDDPHGVFCYVAHVWKSDWTNKHPMAMDWGDLCLMFPVLGGISLTIEAEPVNKRMRRGDAIIDATAAMRLDVQMGGKT